MPTATELALDVQAPVLELDAGDVTAAAQAHIGIITRAVSWVIDAVAINVAAIVVGLGAQLVLSIFPVGPSFASALKPIAAGAYLGRACA